MNQFADNPPSHEGVVGHGQLPFPYHHPSLGSFGIRLLKRITVQIDFSESCLIIIGAHDGSTLYYLDEK